MNRYVILYPESHWHLGLLRDLDNRDDVKLIVVKQKNVRNRVLRLVKKIHTTPIINRRMRLPKKEIWYEDIKVSISNEECEYYIIVFDAAIRGLNIQSMNMLFEQKNVHGILALINSMNASSVGMIDVLQLMNRFGWENIYSFDIGDVKRYGYKLLPFCYYSRLSEKEILEEDNQIVRTDVYYIGGLKGRREKLLLDIYQFLNCNNVLSEFHFLLTGMRRLGERPFSEGIHYYVGGWIPYKKVLQGVLSSKVVLEILQEGQEGPSLRYYEAVCYNKKLITTNQHAKELPYFNPYYMRIITTIEDISIDWITNNDQVDYKYKGEFSPVYLLKAVVE